MEDCEGGREKRREYDSKELDKKGEGKREKEREEEGERESIYQHETEFGKWREARLNEENRREGERERGRDPKGETRCSEGFEG